MRTLAIVVLVAFLAGCAGMRAERYKADCVGYGFEPGTEAMAACMQRATEAGRLRRAIIIWSGE